MRKTVLPLSLLDPPAVPNGIPAVDLDDACQRIAQVFSELGIPAQVLSATAGPVLALYTLELAEGVDPVKVTIHARDFAKALSAMTCRFIIKDPCHLVLEVANPKRDRIGLAGILSTEAFQESQAELPITLGQDVSGNPVVSDLGLMPHLLIGAGSGDEAVGFVHAVLLSLLFRQVPGDMRLLLLDAQGQQVFAPFQGIPHLMAPVVTDAKGCFILLEGLNQEIARRLTLLGEVGVSDGVAYRQKVGEGVLPRIVMAIHGYAGLFSQGRAAEYLMARIAMRGHQVGVHLIAVTRPVSFDSVPDLFKLHFPSRVALKAACMADSRRLVGQDGAEALLGDGDMLYFDGQLGVVRRIHGAVTSDAEVGRVTEYLRAQGAGV
jgi:S-DNA-T family DNA segregation ATPase FtsK/SpoIIIE